MNPLDQPSATHDRPCVICRKRKIRCDKIQPCTNCQRQGQLCSYDDTRQQLPHTVTQDAASKENADMRARLERLEGLMKSMIMRTEQSDGPDSQTLQEPDTQSQAASAESAVPPSKGTPDSAELSLVATMSKRAVAQVGQLIFADGYCTYFSVGFWAVMIDEIEPDELKDLIHSRANGKNPLSRFMSAAMPLPLTSSLNETLPAEPTLEQSDSLLNYFFECINPFLRILHTAHFARMLKRCRRDPNEPFEGTRALLFSIYALTISSMSAEDFEQTFHDNRATWLEYFQAGAQQALVQGDFSNTNNVFTFVALLHYLVLLFQQHRYQDAVVMLGIAAQVATRMGYHRDPSNYPLGQWVCELRRRAWNQLYCLDALAVQSYGIEAVLPSNADTDPPMNADDRLWYASRYATSNTAPSTVKGMTQMTFTLVHRSIAELKRQLAYMEPKDLEAKERLIKETEVDLREKYLRHVDRTDPSQTVVIAFCEDKLAALRLISLHQQAINHQCPYSKSGASTAALDLLEALDYHRKTFTPYRWGWVFDVEIPWLPLAILLTYNTVGMSESDVRRAQNLIQLTFERYSSDPIAATPMWNLMVKLRDRAHLRCGSHQDNTTTRTSEPAMNHSGQMVSGDQWMSDQPDLQDFVTYSDLFAEGDYQDMPWLTNDDLRQLQNPEKQANS